MNARVLSDISLLHSLSLLLSGNRHNGDQLLIVFLEDDTATQAQCVLVLHAQVRGERGKHEPNFGGTLVPSQISRERVSFPLTRL